MKVYATIIQKVEVDPTDVIQGLIEKRIGINCWVEKVGSNYSKCYDERNSTRGEKISKKDYKYVMALNLVLKELKK